MLSWHSLLRSRGTFALSRLFQKPSLLLVQVLLLLPLSSPPFSVALVCTLRACTILFCFRLLALNYVEELPEHEIFRVSEHWGNAFLSRRKPYTSWRCPPIAIYEKHSAAGTLQLPDNHAVLSSSSSKSSACSMPSTASSSSSASRVIRLGYIGPDFFTHSVSYFIHTPLMYHDASRFHVTVYANVVKEDAKTQVGSARESKLGRQALRTAARHLPRPVGGACLRGLSRAVLFAPYEDRASWFPPFLCLRRC